MVQCEHTACILLASLIQQWLVGYRRVDFTVFAPGQHSYDRKDAEQDQLRLQRYVRKYQQEKTNRSRGKTELQEEEYR